MMGPDGFDHFNEDAFSYDDDMQLDMRITSQHSVIITPEVGQLGIEGQSTARGKTGSTTINIVMGGSFTNGTITQIPRAIETTEPMVPEEPADLWWMPIARLIMSPTRFREEWLRHIDDMNFERHECLKRADLFGAR
jgi:hypothetical protein